MKKILLVFIILLFCSNLYSKGFMKDLTYYCDRCKKEKNIDKEPINEIIINPTFEEFSIEDNKLKFIEVYNENNICFMCSDCLDELKKWIIMNKEEKKKKKFFLFNWFNKIFKKK